MILLKRYIELILLKEGLSKIDSVATPLDLNVQIVLNLEGNIGNRSNSFARLLGELQYIANTMWPDIAYVVNRLASFMANPSLQHSIALKRALRYLVGTRDLGIMYRSDAHKPELHGYTDAAYGNSDVFKSTTGYVFIASGRAIMWSSKRQITQAQSSTEAEYVAMSEASHEACWLQSLHTELRLLQVDVPTQIYGDNEGSIAMVNNLTFHKKSKHIAIHWHWVCNLVQDGVVRFDSCRDPQQTADVLMKALPCIKHKQHAREMGLASV